MFSEYAIILSYLYKLDQMSNSTQEGAGPSSSEVKDGNLLPEQIPRATSIIVIGMAGSGKSTLRGLLTVSPSVFRFDLPWSR